MTVDVVTAFDQAALPYVLLKGASIAQWLYPTGGRSYGDADLLVPPGEFERAKAVLRELGFEDLLAGFHPFELDPASKERPFSPRVSSGRGGAGTVDLHHGLNRLPVSDTVLWETFTRESTTLEIGGSAVRVLNQTAPALHIVVHAVQHSFTMHTAEDLRRTIDVLTVRTRSHVFPDFGYDASHTIPARTAASCPVVIGRDGLARTATRV